MDSRDLRNLAEAWQSITTPETETEQLDEFALWNLLTKNRTIYRRDPNTNEKIKVQQSRDFNKPDAPYADVKTTNTGDFGSARKPKPAAPTPTSTPKPDPKPAANPNVTKDGTKFERRLPTMAELRAAQAARAAAKAAGKDKAGQEAAAVKGGVSVSQRKPATTPPPVSAANTAKPAPTSTPAAKPVMTAAGNRQAELAALQAKAKADTLKRSRLNNSVDLFDVVKGHLMSEGYADTEKAALAIMANMSEEWRESIVEGLLGDLGKKVGEVARDVKDRVTGKKELLGGQSGYVRVGGPTKKGDTRVSGIGPVGTYARDGMNDGSNVKSHTQSMGGRK